ncbi:MAG: hypothetical protein ABI855_10915 [Bacteroidota bacterium]
MNKLISKIPIFVFLNLTILISYGQKGEYKPFNLVIVTPDTAVIDTSIQSCVDSVEQDNLFARSHYAKQMENILKFTDYPADSSLRKQLMEEQAAVKAKLDYEKKYRNYGEPFKFYQTISEYSTEDYEAYFNKYPPLSTFQLIPKSNLTLQSLTHIADSLKADYIVGYKNIYIGNEKGNLTIKLTTILYSKKENKLFFEKETITDTKNRGDMQTWICKNQLGSLLILAAGTSSDNVKETLSKLQHR